MKKTRTSAPFSPSINGIVAFRCLEVQCDFHPNRVTAVVEPEGFPVNCPEICGAHLSCGHDCVGQCHVTDRLHATEYRCTQACEKKCSQGHPCNKLCSQRCHPCDFADTGVLACGHEGLIPCPSTGQPPRCTHSVQRRMECGHWTEEICSGALAASPSSWKPAQKECVAACLAQLKCGHSCGLPCHYPGLAHNKRCEAPCQRKRVGCGSDHACRRACHEPCEVCDVTFDCVAECGHTVLVKCGQELGQVFCQKECIKVLDCGHVCNR